MGRLINGNIPTREIKEETISGLYVPVGNKDKRYKIVEVVEAAETSAGTLNVGDTLVVGFRAGVEVPMNGEQLLFINEGEILYIP